MNTEAFTGVDYLRQFCTPKQRDTSPKAIAPLATATRDDVPFTQTLNYPPQPQHEHFTLACFTWGEVNRPAIVMAHGWELQAGRMSPYVAPLLQAGFRVVAFDAPAHGQSGGHELNLPDYAKAYAHICAHVGNVVGLIGHSFGGLAALWLSATMPMPTLRRVVSVASAAGADLLSQNYIRLGGLNKTQGQAYLDAFATRFGALPADFTINQFGPRIQVPVLIVHDHRDEMVGFDESDRMLAHIPKAQRLETNGLGHRSILRVPEVVAAVVDFLRVTL